MIAEAVTEHDLLAGVHGRRDAAAEAFQELAKVTGLVRRAMEAWEATPVPNRQLVLTFSKPDCEGDEVAERLVFLNDLLVEFRRHHARDVGNPGKSRSMDGSDLRPLTAFVDELMYHWLIETSTAPGHKVETAYDLGDDVREGVSPFMVLVGEAAAGALNVRYTIGNIETVVRRLKRERVGA